MKDRDFFDGKLECDLEIISYEGDDSWVEPVLFEIKKCLDSETMPQASEECEYCKYSSMIEKFET